MKAKLKKIFTNARVIILLLFVVLALVAIHPNPNVKGVAIRTVMKNSSAEFGGMQNPKPNTPPMSRERIIALNNIPVYEVEDFFDFVEKLTVNRSFTVQTNKRSYKLTTLAKTRTVMLPELEEITVEEVIGVERVVGNETIVGNKTINKTKIANKTIEVVEGINDIGIKVYEAPTNNIRKGLDLQGGTRVLMQPEEEVDRDTMETLLDSMKQRLNVYGLSDILVRQAGDLSGNQFIIVEVAGANEEEVKDLISKQGKFEAKIGNDTVFRGGQDITYVCRSADCSGIDPRIGCGRIQNGYSCRFRFSITLSPEAAQAQADATQDLDILTTDETGAPLSRDNRYLSKKIDFYLDNAAVDSLNLGADLKGRAVTDIQISGGGQGVTQQEGIANALKNMKRLQTILITGSLPVKLNIVKTDNISPILGEEFIRNAITMAIAAFVGVCAFIYIRYRRLTVVIPVIATVFSEVVMLLGFAALVGWNIDLAAIAGIIIAVGTGVDHLIVITDETLMREHSYTSGFKDKIKKAFAIIFVAACTTVFAMFPLVFAGAGLLRVFALVTIIGLFFGVVIARPAFAAVVEILLKD